MSVPMLRVVETSSFERPVRLRLPFRFGAVTVTEASQIFLRLVIEDSAGQRAEGVAAELMVPKWFDKNPALSNEANADQLRRSLAFACEAGCAAEPAGAFALHAQLEPDHHARCAEAGLNSLVASFGLALFDRAVLDGLCHLTGLTAVELLRRNLPGIADSTTPDLGGFDFRRFLGGLAPAQTLIARHTVGMADFLAAADVDPAAVPDDGLPTSLEGAIRAYGLTHFKLKLSGNETADIARLAAIAAVLDRLAGDYRVTLDGNEQFSEAAQVVAFLRRATAEPRLRRLLQSTLFIEQPIARSVALETPVAAIAAMLPIEIDESDGNMAAFRRALDLGYTGISSKSCKGLYRALLNRARATAVTVAGGTTCFLSAEDLTTQAGIAVQQDLLLASLIGVTHIERNGHHYVDGMQGAPAAEQQAYLAAHGDLYRAAGDRARLRIENGRIAIGSVLASVGLGVATPARRETLEALAAGRSGRAFPAITTA